MADSLGWTGGPLEREDPLRHRQGGMVLIVSLVLLAVMTVAGVTAMLSAGLEERMAGGFRDQQVALQAAEAALRQGEREIEGTSAALLETRVLAGGANCTGGYCLAARLDPGYVAGITAACGDAAYLPPHWQLAECAAVTDVWSDGARHQLYTASLPEASAQAQYLIELVGPFREAGVPVDECNGHPLAPANAACSRVFRVTALGSGGRGSSRAMVQSYVVK
ncbi:MAG: PilX N-terminal domain-containing pilus assembly protein [Pseudomonadota bacterium]|nr:PilX N-terminal domain-containing pilus assembly protein [Pseudomonadota bacterium]